MSKSVSETLKQYQSAVSRRLTAAEKVFALSTSKLTAEKELRDAQDAERLALIKFEQAVEDDES